MGLLAHRGSSLPPPTGWEWRDAWWELLLTGPTLFAVATAAAVLMAPWVWRMRSRRARTAFLVRYAVPAWMLLFVAAAGVWGRLSMPPLYLVRLSESDLWWLPAAVIWLSMAVAACMVAVFRGPRRTRRLAWAYGAFLLPYAVYAAVFCVGAPFWLRAGVGWGTSLFVATLAGVPVVTRWWALGRRLPRTAVRRSDWGSGIAAVIGVVAGLCLIFFGVMFALIWISDFSRTDGSVGGRITSTVWLVLLFAPQFAAFWMAWRGLRPAVAAWCPRLRGMTERGEAQSAT